MRLPGFLRSFFLFNRREQRGLFLLLLILVGLGGAHLTIKLWPQQSNTISVEQQNRLNAIAAKIHTGSLVNSTTDEVQEATARDETAPKVEWQTFDPNTISQRQLEALGLKSWVAQRVVNYREKVGSFQSKEELYKIYDIDSHWVKAAMPFVAIASLEEQEPTLNNQSQLSNDVVADEEEVEELTKTPLPAIELNNADTADLKKIPGIGSYFAREIIETRDHFGGIRSYDQLLDIYMMKDEVMNALVDHVTIDTSAVDQIDINHCRVEDLGKHPYLSWRQAQIIINHRKQRGPYFHKSDIRSTGAIPDTVYLKLAPYITAQ